MYNVAHTQNHAHTYSYTYSVTHMNALTYIVTHMYTLAFIVTHPLAPKYSYRHIQLHTRISHTHTICIVTYTKLHI